MKRKVKLDHPDRQVRRCATLGCGRRVHVTALLCVGCESRQQQATEESFGGDAA